ncbi:hypothetical protein AB0K00_48560 [Dactylosporangium sp. NPDC049525]|uniref:hypothetical protein n=1 Tax=Dactylosporangium sp. NPDC049525 TaxID=3154730 RepID=UPI00342D576E
MDDLSSEGSMVVSGSDLSGVFCCGVLVVLTVGAVVHFGRGGRRRQAAPPPADPTWGGAAQGLQVRVFTNAADFEEVLRSEAPGRIEIEIRESDAGPGGWATYPEAGYRRSAEVHGYTLAATEEGGRQANYGWMGPGDRWMRMKFRRRPAALDTHSGHSMPRPARVPDLPAADARDVMDYVDRVLGCGGNLEEANAAAKLIFGACPVSDPHRRITSQGEVNALLERPWWWLRDLAAEAATRGDAVVAAKLALLCFLWNRVLIAEDSNIQMGALVQAPGEAEAAIYAAGLRAMHQLPADTWLGGNLRGQFLVADSRTRVAGGLLVLHAEGVHVDPDAYRAALEMTNE